MHFTTLFVLKGEKLEDINDFSVSNDFGDRFCYFCGETKPRYKDWCDWFEIGGRWCDILKAKRGIHCRRGWSNNNSKVVDGEFSIAQIKDLTEPLDRDLIYSVATRSRVFMKNGAWQYGKVEREKYEKLLDDIDAKRFDGVIALMDCHD